MGTAAFGKHKLASAGAKAQVRFCAEFIFDQPGFFQREAFSLQPRTPSGQAVRF
jgi:hypothetical protein